MYWQSESERGGLLLTSLIDQKISVRGDCQTVLCYRSADMGPIKWNQFSLIIIVYPVRRYLNKWNSSVYYIRYSSFSSLHTDLCVLWLIIFTSDNLWDSWLNNLRLNLCISVVTVISYLLFKQNAERKNTCCITWLVMCQTGRLLGIF